MGSPLPAIVRLVESAIWCEGVTRLAIRWAQPIIAPAGSAALAATSTRLLRDHGAALHGAGWDALDLFGLHRHAPATNPPGWSLAWLLGATGTVLDVSPMVVGMRRGPDGARVTLWQRGEKARAGIMPAWIIERTGP